jgi:hypothetical protein
MSEQYRIISEPSGEPRAAGAVGVRVRMQLSGCPSRRWSRLLGARLARELVGHSAVGHLRIDVNEIVQGDQIVLDGVESSEAQALAHALRSAVDAANAAAEPETDEEPNMSDEEAHAIARDVSVPDPDHAPVPAADDQSPGLRAR